MTLSYPQLNQIFRTRGRRDLSAADMDQRHMWLSGMVMGSGMELKDWGDFCAFSKQNHASIDYEKEFQLYKNTGVWIVKDDWLVDKVLAISKDK